MNLTNRQNGFTLIEMLVVITITIILLGLIFGPVISSFNLTHRARVMTEAQDTARQTLEQIQRELSQAMFVYDNTQSVINCPMTPDPSNLGSPRDMMVSVKYAKIDFVMPKLMMHCNSPNHPDSEPRDFERGDKAWPSCPYPLGSPHDGADDVEARPVQPLRQEPKIVRYFIGLRDNAPDSAYINYYTMDGYPATTPGGNAVQENTYVLYRAEFSIYDDNLFPSSMPVSERLAWADFFYSVDQGENNALICDNWRKIVKVVGPDEDVDMITVKWPNGSTGNPEVTPAIKFAPTGVDNDTLTATYTSDKSVETPSSCPTTFRATHGHWSPGFKVTVYSGDYEDFYYTEFNSSDGHLWICNEDGNPVFDITQYRFDGSFTPPNPEFMFNVDPNKGEVSFAFSSSFILDAEAIEEAFRTQYDNSLTNHGIGIGERCAVIGGATENIPNAKMIPGSEQVVGPDMTPGPTYLNRMVRYERVPFAIGSAGLNQYRIDYETGEIWFTSDPNTAMFDLSGGAPAGARNVTVTYRFHNNTPEQIVKADYDTKNLLTVALAIRLYDSTSGKPMTVELSDQIQVRNVAR